MHVSPDPDLVTWWLAGIIDERGWGIAGDTFEAMKREDDPWFQLGDRDLELCRVRTDALAAGARLTEAHAKVVEAVGVTHRVLPMSDEPVRTHVRTPKGVRPFQEFMIIDQWAGPIEEVVLDGIEEAWPTPEVVEALATAGRLVVIGLQGGVSAELNLGKLMAKLGSVSGTRLRSRPVEGPGSKGEIVAAVREGLWPLIASGQVKPIVHEVVPMREAAAAHRALESGGDVFGKLLLKTG